MKTRHAQTAKRRKMQKRTALGLVAVLALVVLTAAMMASPSLTAWLYRVSGINRASVPVAGASDSPVGVHIIDVGQGDAVLLEDNGAYALIDAGEAGYGPDVVAYLQAAGVQELDYVFMTHPHSDHIGGMQAVAEAFMVRRMILPNFTLAPLPTTVTLERLLQALIDLGVPAETAVQGGTYPLGQGVVQVVHAGVQATDDANLISLGLLYTGAGMRFLNTGDGEAANERTMLESGLPLAADVFMAAHHGSNTSNRPDFVAAVAPQLVVISCGANNSYGHPHLSALEAYAAMGAVVLRTDDSGSVVVRPAEQGGVVYGVSRQ